MHRIASIAFMLLLTGLLAACGSNREACFNPLLTAPSVAEADDAALARAVQDFLVQTGAPVSSQYSFRRYDLNNDRRRDALVIFTNPYGYWCGLYGCTMLVMKAGDEAFTLVSAVQTVREPIFISDLETNGWKNIVVHVSGRWAETKDVALLFDGEKYPSDPAGLPAYLKLASNQGMALFQD